MKQGVKKYRNIILAAVVICTISCCCPAFLFTNNAYKYNEPVGHEISKDEILNFPDDFLWGAATASYQVEGGNFNSNWWEFEQKEGTIKNNGSAEVAVDHYNKFEEDFDLAKELNLNSYRFSIEWSRIEGEKGKFNEEEIEHYQEMLEALHKRGIKPMVTLWHFSLPLWFEQEGGWENPKSVERFASYTKFVVEKLGEDVELWITINEPMAYLACTYISAKWPPAEVNPLKIPSVFKNLVRGHKKAYEIIHELDEDAQVGISEHSSYIVPYSQDNLIENYGATLSDYFWIHHLLKKVEKELDFIGVHYYYKQEIKLSLVTDIFTKDAEEIEKQSLGRIYYPEGLFEVLMKFKKYDLPIYITEIGVPDYHEVDRDKFINDHVKELYYAIDAGVDVRGFYYWALLDSFEWSEGYGPEFGLIDVDRKTLERSIKDDAWAYALIAGCNCVGNWEEE